MSLLKRTVSVETRKKLSIYHKRTGSPWNIGRIPWNKGKKGVQKPYWLGKERSEKTKEKIRLSKLGTFCGESSPNWIRNRDMVVPRAARKAWVKEVFKRDKNKCRISDGNCKGRLEGHHILSWGKFPELRYEINNGITLCHFHHPRKKEDEMKLSPYFQKLVASSDENY